MKKVLGILAGVVLIFGLLAGTAISAENQAQTAPSQQSEEEFWEKLAQNMVLLPLSSHLELGKGVADKIISALEKFQTDDAVIKEKIDNDWLPTFKEYQKALGNLIQAVKILSEREDVIPKEEIEAELSKHWTPEFETRIERVLDEMEEMGVFQKLQEQE